jgi:hypothetical protein
MTPAALVDTSIVDITTERRSDDYLSFSQIEKQYPNTIKAGTLSVWACVHRYEFQKLVTKAGRLSRVRRDRWEAFLDSRTLGADRSAEAA